MMRIIRHLFNSIAAQLRTPMQKIILLFLLCYPIAASDFFIYQVATYSLILGIIALSLTVLGGYGGMVSLAQLTIAGLAGYLIAILGDNSSGVMGFGWHWWIIIIIAIFCSALMGGFIGLISTRTEGIYTIMITLAIAVAFFYFVTQNYAIFNGFSGFAGVKPPVIFNIYWLDPIPFYYLTLLISLILYMIVANSAFSTFGLALQGIRDNPRRMASLGFDVTLHRILTHVCAGVIAGIGGVLLVWFNSRISPATIGVDKAIDILVIAVIGGMQHPIGPFIGAVAFVLLENFAIDLIDRERFNMVIGVVFLLIVMFFPNGLLEMFQRVIHYLRDKHTPKRINHSSSKTQKEE